MSSIRSVILAVFITCCFLTGSVLCYGQIIVSGTVYDSTKLYSISGVKVISTSGKSTFSDSIGGYHINVSESDSIYFYYANRPTAKFPVRSITNYTGFDISLKVRAKERYKTLQEVRVFTRSHREDSIENRRTYAKLFDYDKPTLRTSSGEVGGAAGFDLDEIIHIFRFRRNRINLRFQKFMVDQEEEKYVAYRFNSLLISKLTELKGDSLNNYKKLYQPSYEFVTKSSQLEFYQYIIRSVAAFRKEKVSDLKNLYQ